MELIVTNINEAVRAGDISFIENHLTKIPNATQFVIDNELLAVAAAYGKLDLLKYFIEMMKISPNQTSKENQKTLLHEACLYGDHQTVEYLINAVEDINAKDQDWFTPAHICVMQDELGCLELLQEANADLLLADISGMQLSHWAADKGRKDILIYLKKLRFPMETKCNVGRTPFIYAIQNGAIEVAEYLVSIGCNKFTVDNNQRDAVHYAAWRNKLLALKFLRNFEFNLSAGEDKMQTPAHLATKHHALDCLHYLLEEGVNPDIRDNFGNTLAHLAVNMSDARYLCCILKHGGSLHELNHKGDSPEYLAKLANHSEVIKKIKSLEKPRTPSPPKVLPGFSRRLSAIAIQGTQRSKKKDKAPELPPPPPPPPIPKRETLCPNCKQREIDLGIPDDNEVVDTLTVYVKIEEPKPEPEPTPEPIEDSESSQSSRSTSRSVSPVSEPKEKDVSTTMKNSICFDHKKQINAPTPTQASASSNTVRSSANASIKSAQKPGAVAHTTSTNKNIVSSANKTGKPYTDSSIQRGSNNSSVKYGRKLTPNPATVARKKSS